MLRVTEGGLRSSVHRSMWEQAFIPVDSTDRSSVKIAVDGVAARIAEAIGAIVILLWLKQARSRGHYKDATGYAMDVLDAARHRRNLAIHHARTQHPGKARKCPQANLYDPENPECERFPDQCPCDDRARQRRRVSTMRNFLAEPRI